MMASGMLRYQWLGRAGKRRNSTPFFKSLAANILKFKEARCPELCALGLWRLG